MQTLKSIVSMECHGPCRRWKVSYSLSQSCLFSAKDLLVIDHQNTRNVQLIFYLLVFSTIIKKIFFQQWGKTKFLSGRLRSTFTEWCLYWKYVEKFISTQIFISYAICLLKSFFIFLYNWRPERSLLVQIKETASIMVLVLEIHEICYT